MNTRDVTTTSAAHAADAAADGRATPEGAGLFSHAALLYSGADEYRRGVQAFVREATAVTAPLHVAVPGAALPADTALPADGGFPADAVSSANGAFMADMAELGRNPARVIPAARSFAAEHPGEHVYCLWKLAWPGRSSGERREVARQEALCNLAFSGMPMTLLCLYDTTSLDEEFIGYAERTHPVVFTAGQRRGSSSYLGPGRLPPGCDDPLPRPGPGADTLAFGRHLYAVREFSARHARAAGLSPGRITDFVIAVSELAANAYGHGGGAGMICAWCTSDELICQVEDAGHITDPLVGSRRQQLDSSSGYGLWLVNEVCDLVERRTGTAGTTTRLHMRRA
jgi:anti-sigma regulatory factor (Ser/Thr protein kinase)